MASLDIDQLRHRILAEKIKSVSIDTSIFHKNGYRLSEGLLALINVLPKNNLRIIISDIVENEIHAHIQNQKEEARAGVESSLRKAVRHGLASDVKVREFLGGIKDPRESALEILSEFLNGDIGATIIKSSDHANLSDVVSHYFKKLPPFEERKKAEFPDAIALSALENWAASEGTEMIVVSADAGWLDVAAQSERLHGVDSLETALAAAQVTQEGLAEAVASAILTDQREAFMGLLNEAFSMAGIVVNADSRHYVEVEAVGQRITDFEGESIVWESFQQIASDDDEFVFSVSAELSVEIDCIPSFEVYDPVDKDAFNISGNEFTISQNRDSDLLVTVAIFNHQPDQAFKLQIRMIEFIERDLTFDVGEIDIDLSD